LEIIRLLVQNLIVIIVLAVFLEMFLPLGDMKRYVRLVMGLLIIIAVLSALGNLTRRSWTVELPEQAVAGKTQAGVAGLSDIMASAKKINNQDKNRVLEEYRQALARQVSALAGLSGEVQIASVEVDIYSEEGTPKYGQVKEIRLAIKSVPASGQPKEVTQPVRIKIGKIKKEEQQAKNSGGEQNQVKLVPDSIKNKIVTTIANFYSLPPGQVKVYEEG